MPCPCPVCQKKGACCYDGTCTLETCADCETLGGLWQGFGTECDGSDCPCSTPADHTLCEKCEGGAAVPSCTDGRQCCEGRCCAAGDLCCSYGCCYCRSPWGWQILDSDNRLYAVGPIINGQFCGLPNPFTPLWYWDSGTPIDFELRVAGCDEDDRAMFEVVSQWQLTVTLCGTTSDRYPVESPVGGVAPTWSGTVPSPTGCSDKLRRCTNDCPEEGCEDCPDLSVNTSCPGGGLIGGTAYRFVGTVDGEWTNLNNWRDTAGFRANTLPGALDDVVIDADVTSKPTDYAVAIGGLTISDNKTFAVEATCATLTCYGTIARPASPVCTGTFGRVLYSAAATFIEGLLEGEVVQLGGSDASFVSNSNVLAAGVVTGNASFSDSDNYGAVTGTAAFDAMGVNAGTVAGDASFDNNALNLGTVAGDASFDNNSRNLSVGVVNGDAVFTGGGGNLQGTVKGDAEFYDTTYNANATVEGNAVFHGSSRNESGAVVEGDATFNDSSANWFSATVEGAATFNDSSYNAAFCDTTAVFNNSAENRHVVSGDATFNDSSVNREPVIGGVVGGNATFNDSSKNLGDVTGTATFNDSSCNSGTAGAFVPNPPPAC